MWSNLNINSLIFVFILWISITVCSPIRKQHFYYQQQQQQRQHHSNSIIHAQIGEVINISCWFDPNLISTTRMRQQQHNYEHHRNSKSLLRTRRKAPKMFPSSHYNDDDDQETNTWEDEKSSRDENDIHSWSKNRAVETPLSKFANKYELDWYFWDKNGKFKIISYGNLTASNYKYKTFVNREDLMTKSSSHNSPQSSALYSQTSSRSSPPNNNNNNNVFTYYLSALIESDQDEGVYQCINPDSPNFILRNVTVLIASNSVSSSQAASNSKYIFILSINLTYLVIQLIK